MNALKWLSILLVLVTFIACDRQSESEKAGTDELSNSLGNVVTQEAQKPNCSPDAVAAVAHTQGLRMNEVQLRSTDTEYFAGRSWVELLNTGDDSICVGHFLLKLFDESVINLPYEWLEPNHYLVVPFDLPSQDPQQIKTGSEKQDKAGLMSLYLGSVLIHREPWIKEDLKSGRSFGYLNGKSQRLYPTPGYQNVPYTLFTDKDVFTVKIRLSNKNYKNLLQWPIGERWYPADFIFNGARVRSVAVRTKGSSTLEHIANLKNYERGFGRFSFKVDFNRYDKDQKFMGMKKLVFNNGYGDPTLMRDNIAYRIFNAIDMPAPKFSYVDLWVQDKHLGLYQMIEPIDGEFVEQYFPDDHAAKKKGDLYKAFSTLVWRESDTLKTFTTGNFPQLELKTNEKTIGTPEEGRALMEFLKSINSGSAERIDTEHMVRYLAAMTLISNYDSYFANEGNYYLYEHRSVGRFTMLPWDFNLALGRSIKEGKKCSDTVVLIDHPTIVPLNQRPIIARVLERDELKKQYHAHLKYLVETVFNPTSMRDYIRSQRELIDPFVKADQTSFYTYVNWKKSFDEDVTEGTDFFGKAGALLPFIDARYNNVKLQLGGSCHQEAARVGLVHNKQREVFECTSLCLG